MTSPLRVPPTVVLACSVLCGLLHAPAGTALESIEITASRLERGQPQLPVARIERTTIDLLQPSNVTDLLRLLPGIDVTQAGGRGGITQVSVRGGEPNFTLVLLDGVPVNDPTNSRGGGFDFNLLDPDMIERIEVFRGGTSAIHGGDALNGVIHVYTRSASARPGGGMRINGGAPRSTGGSFHAGGGAGRFAGNIAAAAGTRESDSSGVAADTAQAIAGLSYTGTQLQLRARLLHARSDAAFFPEDSGGKRRAVLRERTRSESDQSLAALNADYRAHARLALRAGASWSRHQADEDNPGIVSGVLDGIPPNRIESTYERGRVNALAEWQAAPWLDVLTGFAYDHERGTNGGFVDVGFPLPVSFRLVRETLAVFSEAEARW
ncbi:MAG: TonB-dependent receptor plug domain-containing protein, partial [Gammaproteobacteria bacterium]